MKNRFLHKTAFSFRRIFLFFSLMLFFSVMGNAQLLKNLEYFFDKDPGIGKGTKISLPQTVSIDTTMRFDISSLSNGLHTVYLRAQDTAGNWSLRQNASFIKYTGTDSVLSITRIEYYFDTDPGFGNATALTISPANNISNIFNLQVADNGADTRRLYVRAKDSYGRWSIVYDTTIDMCSLYRSRPNFSFIRYGGDYSFIDSTIINTSHKLKWKYDDNTSDTLMNPVHTFAIGKHSVKLVAGQGCRADSITKALYTALESYSPKTVMAGGDINIDFYGGSFDTSVKVTLIDSAGNSMSPVFKSVTKDNSHYFARFDLHNVTGSSAKQWDIKLSFPKSAYDTTVKTALTVLPKPADTTQLEPKVTVSINMPSTTGSNTWHHGSYTLTNTGFVSAKMVPFNFTVDDQLQDFKLTNVHISTDTTVISKAINDSFPAFDHLPVIFGDAHPCKVYSIIIPEIGPGQTITITCDFLTPQGLYAEIRSYAWTGNRMLGSPLRDAWVNCITNSLGTIGSILGLVPLPPFQVASKILNCGSAVTQQLYNLFAADPKTSGDVNSDVVSFGTAMGNTLVNCVGVGDFSTVKQVENLIGYGAAINTAQNGLQAASGAFNTYSGTDACNKCWNDFWYWRTTNFASSDPNEMVGPTGTDSIKHYLNTSTRLSYQVNFENQAVATRAAQHVRIVDTLDRSKMDINTFELQAFVIGDSIFSIPSFRKEYTTTVDITAKQNVLVRFNAKMDTATNTLTADFYSIDPVTKQVITDTLLKGFLPPNTDKKSGTASLVYSVNQQAGNKTGDSIRNRASIVFDNNAAILTNNWLNTIDDTRPTGTITGGKLLNDTTFNIYFSGKDDESGIKSYKLYASVNKGPYFIFQKDIRDSIHITGNKDSTYDFYAVPLDNVNNAQSKNANAEITISLFNVGAIKGDSTVCAGSSLSLSDTTAGGTWSSSNNAIATVSASGVVKGITAGTVTITYSVQKNYFTRSVTRSVVVKPLPTKLTFVTTARSFCDKDSLIINVSGIQKKDSLFWYNNSKVDSSQTVSKTFKDSASVSVLRKDSTGCAIFSDTIKLVRIVVPVPVISQQADSLISSSTTGNQWYLNTSLINGAINQKYKIMNSGTYTVNTTDGNGCKSAFSAGFNVLITATSNLTVNNKTWKVFPNPVTNGLLNIHHDGLLGSGAVEAQITTSDGRNVGERKIGTDTQWNITHLPAGSYYLRIMEKNSVSVYPFIKL